MGLKIHRSRHAQEYVVVPNSAARDARLSFTARGLHHYLLSLPPEWMVSVDQLAKWNPDGRQALRLAMRELRQWGYLVLITERAGRGRVMSHYEVFDVPPPPPDDTSPDATRPASGPTCEDSASPQVAPDAASPASGQAAPVPKYGKRARARPAAPRPPREKSPAAERATCTGCDRPFKDTAPASGVCADCMRVDYFPPSGAPMLNVTHGEVRQRQEAEWERFKAQLGRDEPDDPS